MKFGTTNQEAPYSSWGGMMLCNRVSTGEISHIDLDLAEIAKIGNSFFTVGQNYYTLKSQFVELMHTVDNMIKPTVDSYFAITSQASDSATFITETSLNISQIHDVFQTVSDKVRYVIINGNGWNVLSSAMQSGTFNNYVIPFGDEPFTDKSISVYITYDKMTGLITKVSNSIVSDPNTTYFHCDFQSNRNPSWDCSSINVTSVSSGNFQIQLYKPSESYPMKINFDEPSYESSRSKCGVYHFATNARLWFPQSHGLPTNTWVIVENVTDNYEAPEVFSRL